MSIILYVLVSITIGFFAGGIYSASRLCRKIRMSEECTDKIDQLFILMCQWVSLKQSGKSIVSYFIDNDYCNVAVYGMGRVGVAILNELKNTKINVQYGIDLQKVSDDELTIYKPDDLLPDVDIIVVSAITYYDEIKNHLYDKINCPVVSIMDILEITREFY